MFKPIFEPEKWNRDPYVRNPHNCYTYFLNKIDPKLTAKCKKLKCTSKNSLKPQPGHYSRKHRPITDLSEYTCSNMVQRVLDDNPYITFSKKPTLCPKNSYLGALAVDPGNTYHFYRQDRDGSWSHKDGSYPATRRDASGDRIFDLEIANRNYGYRTLDQTDINYEDLCGYFCIPLDPDKKFMDRITLEDWNKFLQPIN